MSNKAVKIIGLVAIPSIILGFASIIARQFYLLKQFDFSIRGFVVKYIDKQKIIAELILEAINISDIDATIIDYDILLGINNMDIGKIDYNKPQYIKANDKTNVIIQFEIPFKQKFNISDILTILKYYFTDKSKIVISLTGNIKLKHSFIKTNVPIDYKFTLNEFDNNK